MQVNPFGAFASRNPGRRAASPAVKEAAVEAVRALLDRTSMSMNAATNTIAVQVNRHPNSVRRWCEDAGVSRQTALDPLRREYDEKLAVVTELNTALAEELHERDLK